MTETDYAQFQSNHLDQLAKEFDRVCEHHLKQIHENLSNERPPYPPHHVVTLARAVHVLAMRTLNDDHPAKYPLSKSYIANGRHGLHRYWITVFRLNDAINQAAQTNALRLRDRLTGLPIQEWRTPSKLECSKWERLAILPNADRQAADRQAVEIMSTFNWALLAVHFDTNVVVSLAEFDAWAVSTGIAEAGEVSALLHGAEEKIALRARIAEAAIAAEERGEKFDLNKFAAEQQTAPAQTAPAPVVTASDGPAPMTRTEIANCFAGLRGWDVSRWKSELSSPDDWLKDCQQRKGTRGRGGYESTWWPVCIAVAMVERDDTTVKLVSARFKSQELLKPWLDALRINYPDDV